MKLPSRMLTMDSNVFLACLKADETYSDRCSEILSGVSKRFILVEPIIVYQEVCGTLAKKVGREAADYAKKQLDLMIHPRLLIDYDRAFLTSTYPLCTEYGIYAIDAVYLRVALDNHSVLVSLDKEDFIDKVRLKNGVVEAYHVTEFPY